MKGKIDNYNFELETSTNRILVFEDGKGIDPIYYIKVEPNIDEKEFHYEIMSFVSKQSR